MLFTVILLGEYPFRYHELLHAVETRIFSAGCAGIGMRRLTDYCSTAHANHRCRVLATRTANQFVMNKFASLLVESGSSNYIFVALLRCDTQDMVVEKVESIQRKPFAIEDITKTWKQDPFLPEKVREIRQAVGLPSSHDN